MLKSKRTGAIVCALALLFSATTRAVTFEVTGVDSKALRQNIQLHLNTIEIEPHQITEPFWQEELSRIVSTAVEPFGYYNSETQITIKPDNQVIVAVNLDTPLKIANITREIIGPGRDDPVFRKRFNAFPLAIGDVLRQPVYDGYKSAMFNHALTHGYFDFAWQVTRLDLVRDTREANILVIAQSGPRYQFGPLRFVGDDKAKAIIERLKPFAEGEVYSSQKLTDFNRDLNRSGYFSRIIARPIVSDAQNLRVPIEVSLTHKPQDLFKVSLGAATDTGPRMRLGWKRPWVNARGHSISADMFLSDPEQALTLDYRIPMKNITSDYLSVETGYQFVEYSNTATISETLSVAGHRFWQEVGSPWQQDLSLTYLDEEFSQGAVIDTTTALIMPGYGIRYKTKDDDLNILDGNYAEVKVQFGRSNFGSDIDLVKAIAKGVIIRTFDTSHRFVFRAEMGVIETDEFDRVPTSLRFFAGGDRSIRGFAFRDVAPKSTLIDPVTGETIVDPTGGKYLATGSAEYTYQVSDSWRLAAFTDIGTATNDLDTPLTYSIGTGFHWLSPIGPVRLYLARGFAEDDKTWRLHLILGPEIL